LPLKRVSFDTCLSISIGRVLGRANGIIVIGYRGWSMCLGLVLYSNAHGSSREWWLVYSWLELSKVRI